MKAEGIRRQDVGIRTKDEGGMIRVVEFRMKEKIDVLRPSIFILLVILIKKTR
ncbi:hypothetical protein HY489_03315 [Candidatus Woesearchaeota archaeon]|nr:hypothetical protein [Candidatus Woesearchaeota archaeon]